MPIHPLVPIAGLGAAAYFLFFHKSPDPAAGLVAPDAPQAKPSTSPAPSLGSAITSAILSPSLATEAREAKEIPREREVLTPERGPVVDQDQGSFDASDILTPGTNLLVDLFAPEVHVDGGLAPGFRELPPGGAPSSAPSSSPASVALPSPASEDSDGIMEALQESPDLSPMGILGSLFSGRRHGVNLLSPVGRLFNRGQRRW